MTGLERTKAICSNILVEYDVKATIIFRELKTEADVLIAFHKALPKMSFEDAIKLFEKGRK